MTIFVFSKTIDMNIKRITTLVTALMLCSLSYVNAGKKVSNPPYTLKSPDKSLSFTISNESDACLYTINAYGTDIIKNSNLGLYPTESNSDVMSVMQVGKTSSKGMVWLPLWGKRSVVKDDFNEMTFLLEYPKSKVYVKVRAYNDGIAFRYFKPAIFTEESRTRNFGEAITTKTIELSDNQRFIEDTEFRFSGDYTAWFYNGERHNIGPEKLSDANGERLPVMTVQASDNLFFAIHEADLNENCWPMRLNSEQGNTLFKVAEENIAAKQYTGAWRTILIGKTPGNLVDSHLIELLNPEAEGDYSWVKPGVALWDWRIDGATSPVDGYKYKMDYPSWVKMIDFAAENGFAHLVLDANWYGPEFEKDSDPTKGDKARDVQRIIKYGKEKGVGVWLYLNDVAGTNYPIEETLAQYEEWGASGVKYGFMNGNPQEKLRKTINITQLCAKHHLLVDYHDYPVHPYGQMRTYPNAITREYCKAQLDGHQIFQPKTFVTSVFVNMIAGPIDQNNGFMELHQGRTTRKDNNQEVPSTASAEIARTMITWSGATVIPDIPEYYQKYPELLSFLAAEKQPWRESITLDGVIGEYIVMARQNADGNWLVAAATNEDAREVEVDLSFLGKGTWNAQLTQDAEDTHYRTNRETYQSKSLTVTKKSKVTMTMAPGGGSVLLITK